MNRTQLNFILVVVITGACLFFVWQLHGHRNEIPETKISEHHDTYLQHVTMHTTNASGALEQKLRVKKLRHYPQQNRTELEQPALDIYDEKGDHWVITAKHASSIQGTTELTLKDNVHIVKEANANGGKVVMRTTRLIVHPDTHTADSNEIVTIDYPQFSVTGRGLHSDLKAGTFRLLAKIGADYDPQTTAHHTLTLR